MKFNISNHEQLLPSVLRHMTSEYEDLEDKLLMLIGTLVSISSILPNYTFNYGGENYSPHLYLYVMGQAANGKGKLAKCRKILNGVDKYLEQSNSGLLIPGNNTYPGIIQLLNKFNGNGIVIETESDTISSSFEKEYGNYSELLRMAFHHETVSSYRKTEKEHLHIERPKLAMLITGTPDQLPKLFKSGSDGLFSRFMFYIMEINIEWDRTLLKERKGDSTKIVNDSLISLYRKLENNCYVFKIREQDERLFHDNFEVLTQIVEENKNLELISCVKRFGLITFRIAMIISILRAHDQNSSIPNEIICLEDDLKFSLDLTNMLIQKSFDVSKLLLKPSNMEKPILQIFYSELKKLGPEFDKAGYVNAAKKCNINERTSERYIKKFETEKKIIHLSHNRYLILP